MNVIYAIQQLKIINSISEQQIYFITDIQISVLNAVIEREERHTQIYTGSLNMSYIQSHLTLRWILLEPQQSLHKDYKQTSS